VHAVYVIFFFEALIGVVCCCVFLKENEGCLLGALLCVCVCCGCSAVFQPGGVGQAADPACHSSLTRGVADAMANEARKRGDCLAWLAQVDHNYMMRCNDVTSCNVFVSYNRHCLVAILSDAWSFYQGPCSRSIARRA
jgi:hypothetical protein